MNASIRNLLASLALTTTLATGAHADPDRYAWQWPLQAEQESGIWRVELRPDIVENLHRRDGTDLLIADRDGKPVSFSRLPDQYLLEALSETTSLTHQSSLVDLERPEDSGLELILQRDGTRLVLRSPASSRRLDGDGQLIFEALIAGPEGDSGWPRRQLLLTLGSEQRLSMECWLRDTDEPEPASMRAHFVQAGETRPRRLQARIDLEQLARAWHLSCYDQNPAPADLALLDARLESRGQRDHRRLAERVIETSPDVTSYGTFEFEINGPFRLRSIDIVEAPPNLISHLVFESRTDPDQPWRTRSSLNLSTLGERPVTLAEIGEPQRRDRFWRVRSQPALGQAPRLRLGLEVEQIAFLAQGEAPWTLYGGGHDAGLSERVPGLIEAGLSELGPAWLWPIVEPGERQTAAGEQALQSRPSPLPWSRWLLWIVLTLAAALIIWLAVRLLKQEN